jgi:hypothetical protein
MITSETITAITEALISFHSAVGKIKKQANNPFFKSKYADLAGILDSIEDPLITNGLLIVQFPEQENILTTRLLHKSGEWMQSSFDINPVPEYLKEKDKNGVVLWRGSEYTSPQALGSAITYARRYAQIAILNLNIADDDGNAATGRIVQAPKPAITKTLFDKAIARIDKGEKDVIDKLAGMYSLTQDQKIILTSKRK